METQPKKSKQDSRKQEQDNNIQGNNKIEDKDQFSIKCEEDKLYLFDANTKIKKCFNQYKVLEEIADKEIQKGR